MGRQGRGGGRGRGGSGGGRHGIQEHGDGSSGRGRGKSRGGGRGRGREGRQSGQGKKVSILVYVSSLAGNLNSTLLHETHMRASISNTVGSAFQPGGWLHES